MTERMGVLFSRADDLELVRLVDELDYESVWAAEGQGKSAFGKLERWATVTDDLDLATGIVNVFSRSPASIAQAAATLDEHSGGRAILGLGVAHPGVIEGFHGQMFERPLARMHEYITLVRRYLRGEPGSFDGEFYTPQRTHFWEVFEPERTEIPIYNAALGPGNIRLTGQVADGWLPNLYPIDALDDGLTWLETGAKRANRDLDDIDVAMYLLVAVNEDPDEAYRHVARHVAFYLRDIPGFYDRVAEEAGFEDEVAQAKSASSIGAAAESFSREFLDIVSVTGTPDQVRDEIKAFRAAGVDLPIVRAPIGADRDDQERLLRACAPN